MSITALVLALLPIAQDPSTQDSSTQDSSQSTATRAAWPNFTAATLAAWQTEELSWLAEQRWSLPSDSGSPA